ncbi:MAG: DMT family transporter [Anaerolineales bacterium]|nr:DMT family transporter [Anaerolineales bacterium]
MAQALVILVPPLHFCQVRCPIFARAARRTAGAPYFGIFIGIAAVSTASLFIRYAQQGGAPSLVIAAYRLTLASLLLAPLAAWRRRSELGQLSRRHWALALVSGGFLAAHFAAWISSLAFTSVASSVVLVSTSPLFVALVAALALRERLTRTVLVGLALTLAGAAVVALSDACARGCPPWQTFVRGPAFGGDLLALLGAAAGAVYFTIGRALRATMSLTAYVSLTYGTAAVGLLAAAWAAGLPMTGYAPQVYGWFVLLALVPQLVGHSAFNWALRYLPATYVAVTVLGEPIGSIVLAVLLLGEVPSPLKLAGSALIVAGIAVASWRSATITSTPHEQIAS